MTTETQPIELNKEKIVEKKKRVYKKKEAQVPIIEVKVEAPVEAPIVAPIVEAQPPTKPKREKKQKDNIDYNKIKDILSKNPQISEEIESILKKHLN